MKILLRRLRGILCILLISIQLILITSPVLALSANQQDEGWNGTLRLISDDQYYLEAYTGYDYPVRPGTIEWASLQNHNDKVVACEIPEDMLENMTTYELAQTVLAYPLIADIFAYDNWNVGLSVVSNHFNGLEELMRRCDSGSVLVDLYTDQSFILKDNLDDITARAFETEGSGNPLEVDYKTCRNMLYSMVLYVMLSNNTVQKSMTALDVTKLTNAANERAILAETDIIYAPEASALARNSLAYAEASRIIYYFMASYTPISINVTVVKTPEESDVFAYTNACFELWYTSVGYQIKPDAIYVDIPAAYITTLNNAFYDTYGILPESNPTVKYNCHSYAWYQQSSTNPYWIDDPTPYLTDGSYKKIAQKSADVGDRVVYYYSSDGTCTSISHSAVIVSCWDVSATWREFTLKSKWGMSGLYVHEWDNCPYYYTDDVDNQMYIIHDMAYYH